MKHSIQSLRQLINEHITSSVKRAFDSDKLQVEIEGELGEIPETKYRYYYNVKLYNKENFVFLDIPKELIDENKIQSGEYVSITGYVKAGLDFSGYRLEIKIDVSKIKSTDSPEVIDLHKQDQVTISKIKALKLGRHAFPFATKLRLHLITSKSSQVEADFMHELNKLKIPVEINRTLIDMTSSTQIAQAISNQLGDVLVVIRGGGDSAQFEAFNSMAVIEALAHSKAYRILGLGHSNDSTMLELACDYSANTPTAAGTHIREMMKSYDELSAHIGERYKNIAIIVGVVVLTLFVLMFVR